MKKRFILWCAGLLSVLILGATPSLAFTIAGLVRQPLNLTSSDLARMESLSVRVNEVTGDKQFHGVFTYRGVPLRTLLDLASIQKEESAFPKPFDLAVVVKNKEGRTTIISWGEIFHRNDQEVLVAFAAEPAMPRHVKNCGDCHGREVYEPALNQLKRSVGLPKLVVTGDFFTDRNIEDIVSIDVVEMNKRAEKKQMKGPLFSPRFTVTDGKGKAVEVGDLSSYRRSEGMVRQVSEGLGYHGIKQVDGVPLADILEKAGVSPDADSVVLASSIDNYRILLSFGELYLNPDGRRVLVADTVAGKPIKEGKFTLFFPDDLSSDRTAKALSKIEVISLKDRSKIFVIGMGCADANLIALQAISYMGKADVFVAPEDLQKRFAKYMGDKPVLFDPFKDMFRGFRKDGSTPDKAAEESRRLQHEKAGQLVEEALKAGKNVAILEYGDPTIYAPWRGWLDRDLMDRVEIVPGLSAFNAANAMIRQNLMCQGGSLILTSPKALREDPDLLRAVQTRGDTVAIFMGLHEAESLSQLLLAHYPPSTPLQIVYKAGYSNSSHRVQSTVGELVQTAAKDNELHLAMIYVGPCLK